MANEIHMDYDSGSTLYFIIRNSAGQPWDTTGEDFEAWNTMGDYDVAMSDMSGSRYMGSIPGALAAGRYSVQVFLREGGSPADADPFLGGREIVWNGSAEEYVIDSSGRTDVGTVLGETPMSKADVNAEVDTALDTAIPGSPTADSVNERLAAVDGKLPSKSYLTGTANSDGDIEMNESTGDFNATQQTRIDTECDEALAALNLNSFAQTAGTVSDASATTSAFDTDLTEATDNHYNNLTIVFTDGALAGQARRIHDYDGTDKTITVFPAFTEAPGNGNAFTILPFVHRTPSAGALEITYTVRVDDEDTGDLLEGVSVWITTDEAGGDIIFSGVTNSSGVLVDPIDGTSKPWLDAGTYYFWRQKSSYVFVNPDEEDFS